MRYNTSGYVEILAFYYHFIILFYSFLKESKIKAKKKQPLRPPFSFHY